MAERWLVCGTRGKFNENFVKEKLNRVMWNERVFREGFKPDFIIEGCCPDSADVYAEKWAEELNIEIQHHPSTSGSYLKRNIEMCLKADLVIAFWDGYSYGTAHTIAQATMRKIPVIIYHIKEVKNG